MTLRRKVNHMMTPPEIDQTMNLAVLKYSKGEYLVTEIETTSPEAPFPDVFRYVER
jgi:hypothetical protein